MKGVTTQRIHYINTIAPLIIKHKSPILASIRIAQACLESANGTSDLAKASNNQFGIKASAPWTGDSYNHISGEHKGGKKVYEASDFRKYSTIEDSIKDHASFFTSTSFRQSDEVYGLAIKAKDYKTQAKMLGPKFAGDKYSYATDPEYANKLINLIETYNLAQYDNQKIGEDVKMAKIGIDIGHGSNTWATGGGKGVSTGGRIYEEHKFNSIVAIKLKKLLESAGHTVTYGVQQPNSPDTSLKSRTDRFKSEKVDILLSIHANWIGNFKNDTNGIGAFYSNYYAGTRSTNSKKLADLIMSEYRKQGQEIYGAGSIASILTNWTNFHMTREVTMPAVLMELGFMSGTRDFDKVFGNQQDKYTTQMVEGMAKGINAYFGVKGVVTNPHNPQALPESTPSPYVAPRLPFRLLNKGTTVTILPDKNASGKYIWQWYNPTTNKLMVSSKQSALAGTKDRVIEVKKIARIQHSEYMYRLEKSNSWILEEYLVEPRSEWVKVTPPTPTPEPTPEPVETTEGEFILNGVHYKIVKK